MQTNRPLREVPLRALYALHKGIENRRGLIAGALTDINLDNCTLGAFLRDQLGHCVRSLDNPDAIKVFKEFDLIGPCATAIVLGTVGFHVAGLNDDFKGSIEERREFMLRRIVEELRHRGKSIDLAVKREMVEAI